jgi:hypothetical protein
MPGFVPLTATYYDTHVAPPAAVPQGTHPRGRRHSLNSIDHASIAHVDLRPSPTSTVADVTHHEHFCGEPSLPSQGFKLEQQQWAKPQTLLTTRLRLKEPRGIPKTKGVLKWHTMDKSFRSLFNYTSLSPSQVRLMVIEPGMFHDDMYMSLITVDDVQLGDKRHPYCALSYHWGNESFDSTVFIREPSTVETFKGVHVPHGAKRLKVKPNLLEALKHMRQERHHISIWVDAICINQIDEHEKNSQVNKMALIYSKAYNINIWLGSDHTEAGSSVSDTAMAFVTILNNLDLIPKLVEDPIHIEQWASLFELLRWSW